MLKIVVCVKAVPDPKEAHKIKIDPVTKTLMRRDVPLVLNLMDKNAMEAALQLKEQLDAHITVLSMGPPPAGNIVKECLALGADHGYLLTDQAFGGADAYATAYTLAKGIEQIGEYDVVFCGMASSDGSTEWVGPQIATFLKIPVVTRVKELVEYGDRWWKVKAGMENGYRLVQVKLPAVLTVSRELNTPRTLSFSGIIKARKKEIAEWGINQLGLLEETVGQKGSPTIVSNLDSIASRRTVEIISGTREEKAEQLVKKLADAGVI
ncbi:MAG: electron transfer flavoprotein subunit beta/FixA family protein [Desulfobacterales bacterium]|uniref:Electron transfer flavoprotein subunit beta/FixA family protein n=1 Tax=Candidatus Desulfatibia vada TaxID=2841696 RepID=A0A8J6TKW4_9BACT|nr:electron transfer flavoprotein subunit beta/FixA family protein [Candidatus Desulfatibia vada]MBL6972642.1 electron transfer flavoprotein subunit beta/FixA family protein [Desulfobacterales bacterium]